MIMLLCLTLRTLSHTALLRVTLVSPDHSAVESVWYLVPALAGHETRGVITHHLDQHLTLLSTNHCKYFIAIIVSAFIPTYEQESAGAGHECFVWLVTVSQNTCALVSWNNVRSRTGTGQDESETDLKTWYFSPRLPLILSSKSISFNRRTKQVSETEKW